MSLERIGSLLSTHLRPGSGSGNLERCRLPNPPRGGRGRDQCGQATKGVWGMSGRQQAMKGVEDCDKPGGAVKRALRPGFPNDPTLNP